MNDLPVPMSRVEQYLAVAAGMVGATLPEAPMSRLEDFLAVIAGDTSVVLPTPMSLCELWLAYVAGVTPSEPLELEGAFHIGAQKVDVRFFAVAAGMEGVTAPEPQNRTEEYWARIAEIKPIHGVLKYVTGTSITLTDVVSGITSLENVYGDTFQQTYSGIQLCPNTEFTTLDGWTATTYWSAGGDNTLNVNIPANTNTFEKIRQQLPTLASHKYYVCANIVSQPNGSSGSSLYLTNSPFANYPAPAVYFSSDIGPTKKSGILQPDSDNAYFGLLVQSYNKTVPISATIKDLMCVDLTAKYGAGNEPTVEWCDANLSYEPYVGGTASPNPDYPQDIQVVTGTQTITISDGGGNTQTFPVDLTSKNLFNYADTSVVAAAVTVGDDGWVTVTYDNSAGASAVYCQYYTHTLPLTTSTNYKVFAEIQSVTGAGLLVPITGHATGQFTADWNLNFNSIASGNTYAEVRQTKSDFSGTAASLRTLVVFSAGASGSVTFRLSLLADTTVTPQTFQYQQYYTYELVKIGDYQDYIYKSGDDWYVHKENGKVQFNGDESMVYWRAIGDDYYQYYTAAYSSLFTGLPRATELALCSHFQYVGVTNGSNEYNSIFFNASGGSTLSNGNVTFTIQNITSQNDMKAWLASNKPILYYQLATATDTQITDSTLIAQLNAVNSAVLPKPVAYITVGSNNPNLPASIKISYYGEEE